MTIELSKGQVFINLEKDYACGEVDIFNNSGKLLDKIRLDINQREVKWTPATKTSETYIVQVYNTITKEILDSKSFVYN